MTEIAIDFAFIASVFALVSPLIVSLLKDIGGNWSRVAKQATAFVMALIGSFVAFGVSQGWSSVVLGDWVGFWQPLIIGVLGIFGIQYATYMGIWKDTAIETAVAEVGAE